MTSTLVAKPLGQLLLDRGHIQTAQLNRALDEQRRSHHQKLLGEILVELRHCSEDQVAEALAESHGFPFARLTPRLADGKVIGLLPDAFLDGNLALPLFLVDGVLTVALAEPTNVFLIEEIERLTGKTVQVVATTPSDVRSTLAAYRSGDGALAIDASIEDVPADELVVAACAPAQPAPPETRTPQRAEHDIESAPRGSEAERLVRHCLHRAIRAGANGIHIEPDVDHLRIRYRIDGALAEPMRVPLRFHRPIAQWLKSAAGIAPTDSPTSAAGSFRVTAGGRDTELQVSAVPARCGERLVVRILDGQKPSFTFEQLGFSYDMLKRWRRLIARPGGLMLVSGPAFSGHLTTLYSSLESRNSPLVNACTIEQPIRYAIPGVNQFAVDAARGFSTAAALEAVLRQDPDVLMVTDLPDADSAKLAVRVAMEGHLVLTGLHASDAPLALARLQNLGVEPHAIASTVGGILAQRLVRRLCPACREPYNPPASFQRLLDSTDPTSAGAAGAAAPGIIYRAKGCEQCRQTGYSGRVGIFELLVPDDAMIDRLAQGLPLADLRDLARKAGLQPLRADGLAKIKAGITTLDEVARVTA